MLTAEVRRPCGMFSWTSLRSWPHRLLSCLWQETTSGTFPTLATDTAPTSTQVLYRAHTARVAYALRCLLTGQANVMPKSKAYFQCSDKACILYVLHEKQASTNAHVLFIASDLSVSACIPAACSSVANNRKTNPCTDSIGTMLSDATASLPTCLCLDAVTWHTSVNIPRAQA